MNRIYLLWICILWSSSATAQFVLQKAQVNAAGGTLSDGTYKINFSVGSPVAGILQDANYETIIGFYPNTFNHNPTALFIQGTSTASIDENKTVNGVGNLAGALTTTDIDVNDTHTYTLVAGTGDTDNAIFAIVGHKLFSQQVLDFETKPAYSVRVQTNDGYGGTTAGRFEQIFTINVNNLNDAPTDLAVDGGATDVVDENLTVGALVGILTTTDQDNGSASDTHTYSLAAGVQNNDLFAISGNQLITDAAFDFENKASYTITLKTTDSGGSLSGGGLTFEKNLTITINDKNDKPTNIVIATNATYAENLPLGTSFATLASTDQDAIDTYTYALVSGAGDNDNGFFEIVNNEIKNLAKLNFERTLGPVFSVRVETKDSGNEVFQKIFTITLTDVDDAPSGLTMTSYNILEGNLAPTTLGLLIPSDDDLEANDANNYSWTLLPQQDYTSFLIGTDLGTGIKSLVANTAFNFGSKSIYNILIRVNDVKDLNGNTRAQGVLYSEIPIQVQVLSATGPNITNFSPQSGTAGTSVTITGTNFSTSATNNIVKFNGSVATITGTPTTTSIVTSVPTGATTGKITVEVNGQAATSVANFTVTIVSIPTIAGFNPTSGSVGTSVTLTGTNFSTIALNNIVKINGTLATITGTPTATTIVTSVPAGATSGKITVNVGGQTATSVSDFVVTVIPTIVSFNPTSGPVGTSVTLTGTNFSTTAANNTLKFNETLASITGTPTATAIVTSVPPGAATGKITVDVGGQIATSAVDFTVITDITPPLFGTNRTASLVATGAALAVSTDFTDPETGVVEALVQFRSVNATTSTFTDAALTKGNGSDWTGSIPTASIGELGVEYKFKIKNGIGLESTSSLKEVTVNYGNGVTVAINTTFTKSQSNYRMIAVPLVLTANSVNAIFSEKLGGYDENVWRMYRYEKGSMNKLTANSTIDPGKGYWFISTVQPTGSFVTGTGTTVLATTDQPFEITLSPGWNQIGNPYNFDISWTDVRQANPALKDKLSATARSYNGSVIEIDEIKKFEGAFVSFTGAAADKIEIPVAKNPLINGRVASGDVRKSLSGEHWEVKFDVFNGAQHYTLGGMGMHPNADENVDAFDDFNVPRFFDYLELKHPKQILDMSYTKDVVGTQQEHTWNFNTETNQGDEAITLAWDNSYFGNGSEQLWLMDVESGSLWDMKKENKASLPYQPVRRWRVAFGSEAYVKDATLPEHNGLLEIYPNPFAGEISIEMAIVEPTHVVLDVLDVNGKKIMTLVNQLMNKGRFVNKWIEQNSGQDGPPSGFYIVRFQAGNIVEHKRIVKN